MTDATELTALIAALESQEERLRFPSFTQADALGLGSRISGLARVRTLSITVDVTLGEQQIYHVAMPGTTADNDYWIARKIRTVKRFGSSSYLVGLRHRAAGTDFNESTGLPFTEYVAHGGCFPVVVTGSDLVGTVTVSGLPQADDHALVVEAIEAFLEHL